mgnify:CR=1 FL=1
MKKLKQPAGVVQIRGHWVECEKGKEERQMWEEGEQGKRGKGNTSLHLLNISKLWSHQWKGLIIQSKHNETKIVLGGTNINIGRKVIESGAGKRKRQQSYPIVSKGLTHRRFKVYVRFWKPHVSNRQLKPSVAETKIKLSRLSANQNQAGWRRKSVT